MTFKQNWEKTNQRIFIPSERLQKMVALAYPTHTLLQHEIIAGGCANLNIKIEISDKERPFILRIYLRDKAAAFREQKLASLLQKMIPIPEVYFIGDQEEYRFAIVEYCEGITLRDFLLSNQAHDTVEIMSEVGQLLAKIQSIQFSRSGLFDEVLKVAEVITSADYMIFAKSCLIHPVVIEILGNDKIAKIEYYFEKYKAFFPDEKQHGLVHADFDPANILVVEKQGKWQVSAILDWEFAFSSSVLWDVANMLRYAHQMPQTFQKGFLHGLAQGGIHLPKNWQMSIYLLNILSLLDCLVRSTPQTQPSQCNDIHQLISHFLEAFDKKQDSHNV